MTRNLHRIRRLPGRAGVWAMSWLICCMGGPGIAGEIAPVAREYSVKAAFLFNFAQFVTWPDRAFVSEHAPFCIGILGQDPFGGALEEIVKGESIKGHPMTVRRFASSEVPADCQILFISRTEEGRLSGVLSTLQGRPVLTVSELEQFGQRGGVIRLLVVGKQVRFEINAAAAERSGLKLSSKLLHLARLVQGEPEP
jgi:hypothetical protein